MGISSREGGCYRGGGGLEPPPLKKFQICLSYIVKKNEKKSLHLPWHTYTPTKKVNSGSAHGDLKWCVLYNVEIIAFVSRVSDWIFSIKLIKSDWMSVLCGVREMYV